MCKIKDLLTCLLLKNERFVSVLVALLVGTATFCLALFLVSDKTTDPSGNSVGFSQTEQNLGAQYKYSWDGSNALAVGVVKLFSVPVWDNAQGLGNRMPNLITQPSQSPTVFLASKLPVEYVVLLRNLIATIFCLVLLNLAVSSWSSWRLFRRLIFLDVTLTGPYFLYTSINGWYHQADQFWGICLVISGFLHASWYQNQNKSLDARFSPVVLTSFVLGLGILFVGHVLYFQIIFLATLYFLIAHRAQLQNVVGSFGTLLLLVLIGALVIPQIIELANQKWNATTNSHIPQTSLLDFFQPSSGWVYRFQPILVLVAISFQPILRIVNEAGSRTEFFNFLFIPFIFYQYLKHRFTNSPMTRMVKHSLGSLCCMLMAAFFVGAIQRADLYLVSRSLNFHVWQLSQPILILISVTAMIVLGNRDWTNERLKSVPGVLIRRIILPLALLTGLLYPIVMVTKFMHVVNPRVISDQYSAERLSDLDDLLGLSRSLRHVFIGDVNFENKLTGSSENMELQRAGYPSIQSITYGRSSSTLRYAEQSFRSVFDPSISDCQPDVLDFLAVSTIVFESGTVEVCKKNLETYYQSNENLNLKSVGGSPLVLSALPKQFSSWSIPKTVESNKTLPCPVLDKDCLVGLTVTKLIPESGSPFRLCVVKCLFTYEWGAPSSSKKVLVPENFDRTIEIRDLKTGLKLKTANYQGLLAVEIPSGATSGVFEAKIVPDAMMWARVAATYLHTFVLLITLSLVATRGLRARISDKQDSKTA